MVMGQGDRETPIVNFNALVTQLTLIKNALLEGGELDIDLDSIVDGVKEDGVLDTDLDTLITKFASLRWGDALGEPVWVSGLNYTASTISFDNATSKILDSANGLAKYTTGQTIYVTGSLHNNGKFTIVTGGVAGEIVTAEAITTEAAGAAVSIKETVNLNPGAGELICDYKIGAGKSAELFGFQITADEGNTFSLKAGTYEMERYGLGAQGSIVVISPVQIEPTYAAGVVFSVSAVTAAAAGKVYQARLLVREH